MMSARTKRIAEECVRKDIPFAVLPATDAHALAAFEHYVELCDEDDDTSNDYVRAVSSDALRMESWRNEHPEDVGPPELKEGEN